MRLRLTFDSAHNGGHPIAREWDLPAFHSDGKTLTDQCEMRQGFIKRAEEHRADLAGRYPEEHALVYVGNGNLGANFDFVAWSGGVLYHLADELVFKQPYTCLVSWKDGRITVEDFWFAYENGTVIVLRKMDNTIQDVTEEVSFTTSGQSLVRGGEALPLPHIAEQWYDTRHLVAPLRVTLNGTMLFVPNAQLQHGLLRKALCQPVHIRLEAEINEHTTLPLTTSGWLHAARESSVAFSKATAFLRACGILKEHENPEEPSVLIRLEETAERLLSDALREAGYQLVEHSRPLREGEVRFASSTGTWSSFSKKRSISTMSSYVGRRGPAGSSSLQASRGKKARCSPMRRRSSPKSLRCRKRYCSIMVGMCGCGTVGRTSCPLARGAKRSARSWF